MKKFFAIILTFVMCFGVLSVAYATENKTEIPDGYTPVYTAEDLNNIRNNLSGKYILMNDIDLSSFKNWTPIGTLNSPFAGEFNGNSFTVKNLKITKAEGENPSVGLFGTINNSQIENVTIVGKINVHNDNGIRAGLICGEAYCSEISNCITYGEINASTNAGAWVGGITGFLSIYTETENKKEDSTIKVCRNNAKITANVFRNEDFFGLNYFTGGVVGLSDGTISECSNYGNITAVGKSNNSAYFYAIAGGICGNSSGKLNNCYNVGNISAIGAKYTLAGGISGHWYQFGDISNCYNAGQIESEAEEHSGEYSHSFKGGIAGCLEGWYVPDISDGSDYECHAGIYNCYYLDNVEKAFGDGIPENQKNVKPLTKEEMTKQELFVGFDFENIWEMDEEEQRPVLRNVVSAEEPAEKNFFDFIKTRIFEIIDNIRNIFLKVISWLGFNQ